MAKTFNSLVDEFISVSQDSSGSAIGKTFINTGIRKILGLSDWTFMKDSKLYSTGTNVQDYDKPYNANKIDYVRVWYGGVWYTPREVILGDDWSRLNAVNVYSSIPQYWYVSNRTGKVSTFPISSDANGTVKIGFTKRIRDLSVADYSTGSVSGDAGGTRFTGTTSASWTALMTGRYLQVSGTNTITDGFWFEITDVSSGSLTTKELIPVAISNSAYTIAELIPMPEGSEELPLWYALEKYYRLRENTVLAREFERMWKEGTAELKARDSRSVEGIFEKNKPITTVDVNTEPWYIGTIS